MSDLDHYPWEHGDTYGDSHDWVRSDAVKNPATRWRSVHWQCLTCGCQFDHEYHVVKEIRQAMRQCGISDKCEKSSC